MRVIKVCSVEQGKLEKSQVDALQKSAQEAFKTAVKIDDKYIQYIKAERDDGVLLGCNMHPLVQAVHLAYADHLPLNLSPDMIWYVISSGVASHINLNAEKLRDKFVDHQGKKRIEVRRDDFVMNKPNPWNEVVDEFCVKLGENTKADIADTMQANFSTTTKDARVVSQIVLMDAMQQYFEYYFSTLCGIPEIRLSGNKQDWEKLTAKAKTISAIIPELEPWWKALFPILQQFVDVFDDKVDEKFWNEIYKVSGGSGGPYLTGWLLALFPYLKDSALNQYVWQETWQDSVHNAGPFSGITTNSFIYHMNQVPFIWNYFGTEVKMLFIGGLLGVQYEKDDSLTPIFGYGVTEDKVELNEKQE